MTELGASDWGLVTGGWGLGTEAGYWGRRRGVRGTTQPSPAWGRGLAAAGVFFSRGGPGEGAQHSPLTASCDVLTNSKALPFRVSGGKSTLAPSPPAYSGTGVELMIYSKSVAV